MNKSINMDGEFYLADFGYISIGIYTLYRRSKFRHCLI